jgi:Holliday junction resolvasome RuvABC endonuclease subunit
VKKTIAGFAAAGKAEIQAALTARYPNVATLAASIPASQIEHPFDALAAAVTCLDSDVGRAVRRL